MILFVEMERGEFNKQVTYSHFVKVNRNWVEIASEELENELSHSVLLAHLRGHSPITKTNT